MYEKVNPAHPDKIADRIAGAIVDLAYNESANPKIAVEVLIGHGICNIVAESSVHIPVTDILEAVSRIAGDVVVNYHEVAQDYLLAKNQAKAVRCGDNGIFRGVPVTDEQRALAEIAREIYARYPYDGKYILDGDRLIICQSHADNIEMQSQFPEAEVNPLGDWTGGTDVDTGATNRKLGSDMADSVTGGGLHGKDLSKADVSVNIYSDSEGKHHGIAARCRFQMRDHIPRSQHRPHADTPVDDFVLTSGQRQRPRGFAGHHTEGQRVQECRSRLAYGEGGAVARIHDRHHQRHIRFSAYVRIVACRRIMMRSFLRLNCSSNIISSWSGAIPTGICGTSTRMKASRARH